MYFKNLKFFYDKEERKLNQLKLYNYMTELSEKLYVKNIIMDIY